MFVSAEVEPFPDLFSTVHCMVALAGSRAASHLQVPDQYGDGGVQITSRFHSH